MASLKFACVVLVMCMVVVSSTPMAEAAITCAQVYDTLRPCIPYIQNGGVPPAACCDGVRTVKGAATTTFDRRDVCTCLKSAAASLPAFNADNAGSLPGKCGVSIPFQISPSTDCATITF